MDNIKVSVIIPVYNVEKYLKQCLDSIVNQTLKDIEIICIDAGSTDGSVGIIKEYQLKDNRIDHVNKVSLRLNVFEDNYDHTEIGYTGELTFFHK